MAVRVAAKADIEAEAAEKEEAKAVTTPRLSLRSKRQEIEDKLYIDLKVPRWDDPEIFVRYGPINASTYLEQVEKRQKSKSKEWSVLANSDALVTACIGVYACLDEDYETKYSLREGDENGKWTRLDGDLGANLGLPREATHVNVIRELYQTDGDLLNAASEVFEWSGMSSEKVDEDF